MNEISGSLARTVITAEAPAYATPSRRALLHAGCASRALIALPAAMSLGIVLASPAHAQKSIPGQANGVNLNAGAYASYRSFTISSGSTISSAVTGVAGVYGANPANADTLANNGVVSAALASGVTLAAAGSTVSNAGTIHGGAAAGDYGVKIGAGPSSIANAGVITGYVGASANNGSAIYNAANALISGVTTGAQQAQVTPGTSGAITNRGTIAESAGSASPVADAAVSMQGGYFHNTAGGVLLSNASGVYADTAPITAVNAGIISAGPGETSFASYGMLLSAGGTITNETGGTIAGNTAGILITGTVVAVTNQDGATIAGGGFGLYATAAGESISNAGVILQTATAASQVTGLSTIFSAVYLKTGGAFTNTTSGIVDAGHIAVTTKGAAATLANLGTIAARSGIYLLGSGTISNSGLIGAADTGVYIGPASGTIINATTGTISGGTRGVFYAGFPANLTNAGTILSASGSAVAFQQGGTADNLASGNIIGAAAGIQAISGVGTIINTGMIGATAGAGVLLDAGGSVSNFGTIGGARYGIEATGGFASIANSGAVTAATGTGILLSGGGFVTNSAGGIISGQYGVSLTGGGTVQNDGLIAGNIDAVAVTNGGEIVNALASTITGVNAAIAAFGTTAIVANAGTINATVDIAVALQAGGSVVNESTGLITAGGPGVYIANAPGTVSNAGQIITTGFGVVLKDGGFVTNSLGGIITSTTTSGVYLHGASALNPDAALQNDGSIIGGPIGVRVRYGISIVNDRTGTIYGTEHGVFAEGAAINITNSGSIGAGSGAAIDLAGGGTVTNMLTGTITGGTNGVYVTGGPGTVFNTGTISGSTSQAVLLEDGGAIVNQGVLISAGPEVIGVFNTSGNLDNLATIASPAGTAVLFAAGGNITNQEARVISGAAYGIHAYGGTTDITNLGTIIATSGTGVAIAAGTVTNEATGVIEGGTEGLSITGPGAVFNAGLIADAGTAGAVIGSGVTVTNMPGGTITGTTGAVFTGAASTVVNEGTIAGTVDAVSFASAFVNFLTLTTGQTLIGAIDGAGSNSQIALDGIGTLTNTITDFGPSSGLNIAPGANWTATGSWQIATVTNDGVFQPGIIGTPLALTGNFVQNADGTLQVIVTPAASSQLLVAGTATLRGALSYNFAPGTYSPKTYAFLTTTGATIGTFSKITYNGAPPNLLDATTYEPNATSLVLYAPGTPAPASNPTPIIIQPADDSIFSDEIQQSAINAQASNMALLGKASESAAAAGETAVCAAQASITPANTTPGNVSRTAMLANAVGNAFCGAGGWVQGSGSVFTTSGGSGPSYNANNGGFLAGIDKAIDGTGMRLGVAVGYDESNIKTGFGSKGTVDTIRAGVFASEPIGVFTIAADLMYGHADTTTTRLTGVGAAASKESGNIFSGGIQAETMLPIGAFSVMPAVGLRIAHVGAGAFAETAPSIEQAFAVRGASSSYTSIQPYVNLDISTTFTGPGNITITPDVAAEYFYEAGNRGRAVALAAPDGTNFESEHVGLAGNAAALSAGISAGANNWAFYASYTAELGGNWTSQTGELGFRLRF
jgi:uncharacterized protein with beta-barrel porin domain